MVAGYPGVRRPSKQTTFIALMAVSAVLMLLPRDFLGPARDMSALIAVPQWMASEGARTAGEQFQRLGTPAISAEEHAALVSGLEALRNENASLIVHMAEAQARINDLTRIRSQSFPEHGRLIPAKVIAADASALRGSMLLSKGSISKVREGDWVVSRRKADAGSDDGVRKGAGVLARETLIGWVESTEAFTSRVVLLSDNFSPQRILVHIGPGNPGKSSRQVATIDGKPASFALEGAGRGLMKMEVAAGWVDQKIVQVGDIVTSNPGDARLPVAMVIGDITSLEKIRDDKKKPLYYTAIVKHRYDPQTLAQAYIADFSREAEQQ